MAAIFFLFFRPPYSLRIFIATCRPYNICMYVSHTDAPILVVVSTAWQRGSGPGIYLLLDVLYSNSSAAVLGRAILLLLCMQGGGCRVICMQYTGYYY